MSAVEAPAVLITQVLLRMFFAAPVGVAEIVSGVVSQADSLAQTAGAGADETRRAVTFLVLCLIAIAVGLIALTVWYWQYTSPRKQAEVLLDDLGHYGSSGSRAVDVQEVVDASAGPPLAGSAAVARPFATVAPATPVKLTPADAPGSERIEFAERTSGAKPKHLGPPVKAPTAKPPAVKLRAAKPQRIVPSRSPVTVPVSSVSAPPTPPPIAPAVLAPAADAPRISVSAAAPAGRPTPPRRTEPRRAKQAQVAGDGQEGLSDDDWAAVMQSAFKHLQR